jgi:uncharacterized membrane protein (UPF0127 family)
LIACSPQAPAAQSPNERPATAEDSAPAAASPDQQPQTGLREVPLTIRSKGGTNHFTVQVAATQAQQERGLMFVTSLPDDRGMIFPYSPAQEVSFWMKNTLIPLDIVFIRANGTIARITNAQPMDITPLPSGEPIVCVLEIRGGRAAELGIREGDKVTWTH